MLNCEELSERATDYLESALSPTQLAGVKMHLLICKHCRAYVDQLVKTIKLLKAAGESTSDLTPDRALLAGFRTDTSEPRG